MPNFRHPTIHIPATVLLLCVSSVSTLLHAAEEGNLAPTDDAQRELSQMARQSQEHALKQQQQADALPDTLPKAEDQPAQPDQPDQKQQSAKSVKQQAIDYLADHPDEMEDLLLIYLSQGNVQALKDLLPVYARYDRHDPSVIDWGNAIIKAKSGDLTAAIKDYRSLNAKLPDSPLIQFQLAMALYHNQQYAAAKNEFEKLRAASKSDSQTQAINAYLDAINKQNSWDFNLSASYIKDDNITNAPPVGSKISRNGGSLTYSSPHQSGEGIQYGISADKKWLSDDKTFVELDLGIHGKYYWDNDNYNDVTASAGVGVGYQNAITEVSFGPIYDKRWYAGGSSGEGKLAAYSESLGLQLKGSQWFGPKLRYYGIAKVSDNRYDSKYQDNNGSSTTLSNNLFYFTSPKQFFNLGLDHASRHTKYPSDSYSRKGVRLGWGQTWGKGVSTNLSVGYAQRDYKAADYTGIQRENKEYSAGVTVWSRAVSVLGLTPRIRYDYIKVNSNSAFEEYDKHNVLLELSKTF